MSIMNHDFWAYRDAFSNTATGRRSDYVVFAKDALRAGMTRWIGYVVPPFAAIAVWSRRFWRLAAVHAAYHLVSLITAAEITAAVAWGGSRRAGTRGGRDSNSRGENTTGSLRGSAA